MAFKTISVPVLCALAIMAGAGKCGKAQADDSAAIAANGWELHRMHGDSVMVQEGSQRPTLYLNLGNGTLRGNAGCNRILGAIDRTDKGISMGQLGATKMYCEGAMELERSVLKTLESVDGYVLQDGILLLTQAGSPVMMLRSRPLEP